MMYEQMTLLLQNSDYTTIADLTKTALIAGVSSWHTADVHREISEHLKKSKSSNFYVAKELAKIAIFAKVSVNVVVTAHDQIKNSFEQGAVDYLTVVALVKAKFRITESALPQSSSR